MTAPYDTYCDISIGFWKGHISNGQTILLWIIQLKEKSLCNAKKTKNKKQLEMGLFFSITKFVDLIHLKWFEFMCPWIRSRKMISRKIIASHRMKSQWKFLFFFSLMYQNSFTQHSFGRWIQQMIYYQHNEIKFSRWYSNLHWNVAFHK